MFDDKEDIDFILESSRTQVGDLNPAEINFILEDFPEGKKIIINDSHLFEIIKVENGTVLMKPICTNLLAKQTINTEQRTITCRSVENGKIVEKNM